MRLLPRNEDLFVHLREQARFTHEAADRLYRLCSQGSDASAGAEAIAELERRGSEVTRRLMRALRDSFITPLDRNDMHRLGKRLDKLLKTLNSAAWRMCCYGECGLSGPGLALCETTRAMIECLHHCVDQLAEKKQHGQALDACNGLGESARKVEAQLRDALTELLTHETSAATLVKRKDIFEQLKLAADHCEAIADTIVDMLLDE